MSEREAVKIGVLFNPDDLVGQWVFALAATTADLGHAEALFQVALQADDLALRTLYRYRQVLARLYEAERVAPGNHRRYSPPCVPLCRSQGQPRCIAARP